jgi:hypothetical protein
MSFLVQAFSDHWIDEDKQVLYGDILKRLLRHIFLNYLDQEHGSMCICDEERACNVGESITMLNFDVIRQLLLWSRMSRHVTLSLDSLVTQQTPSAAVARYVSFAKESKKEQGLFIYRDPRLGISMQLPLIGGNGEGNSLCGAFPHCVGIFDVPVNHCVTTLTPELIFDGMATTPSFYGKNISTGLGPKKEYQFRYEQPDLISVDEVIIPNLASCKVTWSFFEHKICGDFVYFPKRSLQLDSFHFSFPVVMPHSRFVVTKMLTLKENGLRPTVLQDDFQGEWQALQDLSGDANMRTHSGKICYFYTYARCKSLYLRSNRSYHFSICFEPDWEIAE